MNVKHIVKRTLEEIRSTFKIAKKTSIIKALNTFRAKIDIQILSRNGFKENSHQRKRLLKKHETMLEYYEKEMSDFIASYQILKLEDDYKYDDKIWICWWQGLENAPKIVKRCIESIKKNSEGHEVVVITENNYRNYIDFPDFIYKKREKGIISLTHLSDLLRFSLLAKYGGMWLDATFFCSGEGLDKYFKNDIWSIKRPDYLHCSVACGYFANYSFQCSSNYRWVFAVIRDFYLQYWKTNDMLIDYLTTDYLIVLIQKHYPKIREAFESIEPNNPNCDELFKVLRNKYDVDVWIKLKRNTNLFKLTWKIHYKDENGSFYTKLVNGKL